MIERLIENYKILELINHGDQTAVYKAVDLSLKRLVLAKVLNREAASQPRTAENFRREASVLARFNHSSVPALYALKEIDGEIFMFAEFPEGETLESILRRGEISAEKASKICAQIFDSFDVAHQNEIFHGALHGADIVVNDSGGVKILNFGAFAGNESVKTADKIKNDIRLVAILIYEMLSGEKFFASGGEIQKSGTAVLPEHLSVVKNTLPEKIGVIISDVLRPKKIDPFQTIGAFRAALTANGFDVSSEKINDFTAGDADKSKKLWESDPGVFAAQPLKDVVAVGSFENQTKRSISEAAKRRTSSASQKSVSLSYKIAGAAVLLVLVTHFVWQFSFIQKENLRAAETDFQATLPIEKSAANEPNQLSAEIKTEVPPKPIENELIEEDEESPKPIKIVKIEVPSVKRATETKAVPKNKSARETHAERLRRAEKLLTGF